MPYMDYILGREQKTPSSLPVPLQPMGPRSLKSVVGGSAGGGFPFPIPGGAKDFFLGKGSETKTQPIYNPQQEQLLNKMLGALQQNLPLALQNIQNILGGDPETLEAFARPARREFEEETLPTIAERFTSTFGPGSQRSSGFIQAVAEAGRRSSEDVASQRRGLQSGALQQLMGLVGPALAPRQQQYTTARQPGFAEEAGVPAVEAFIKILPALIALL